MKNLNNVIRSRASRFVSLRVVLILSAVMVFAGFGAASAWNGEFQFLNIDETSAQTPDSPQVATISNYVFSTASGVALEDMTGSIQLLGASEDDTPSAVTNIGFDFFFMGVRYAQFSASSNGLVSFGATTSSSAGNDLATANPKAAAYWDDLCTSATGKVHYKVVGSAPSRKIVVEFQNMRTYSGDCTAGTLLGNYQVWLYESVHTTTPGVVQFVYGAIPVNPNDNSGYTVGISSSATSFASVTTATDTNSFAASNNTQTVAITAGKSYLYTPPLTNGDPTNLTFTNVMPPSVTLNWVDNSTNEAGFPIYISSDGGTTYTFIGTAPENATSFGITGLAAATTYFFRVYAVTEGALSTGFAQNSVTTSPPISGTKTLGPGGDYTTFAAAIVDANAGLGAGGVTFNVTAGTTFAENGTCITGGSSTTPIIFQRSGAGANPIIQPPGSAGTQDAGVCILGGDFITFDGIDVAVAGGVTTVEYGYLVSNSSATNGAQNNTIQNSKITLNRTNTTSTGISHGFSVAATAATGAQSNNKYYNITVENSYKGITLTGNGTAFPDTNNEVGVTGGGTTTIGAATANDIGNSSTQTWGIRSTSQSGVKIFNTEIRNVTATTTVDGIFLEGFIGTNEVYNNKVHDIRNASASSTSTVTGIRATHNTTGTNVARIYNNFVYGMTSGYASATVSATRQIKGIFAAGTSGSTSQAYNVDFNSVRIDGSGSPNISSAVFEIATTSGPVINVRNNIFANFTGTQTGVARHTTWRTTSGTLTGNTGSVSNRNVLHIANPANGVVGITIAADQATLANWRTATSQDANSFSQNPMFVSATDLHIQTGTPTPVESNGSYFAGAITWAANDIDAEARNVTTPDIGADEGTFTTLFANDIAANAILVPAPGAFVPTGATVTPQATFENHGTANQTNVPVQFTITGPGSYSYTSTPQNIATLNAGVSQNVTFSAAPAFTTGGTYTMTATASLVGDSFTANDSVMGNFTVFAVITGGTVNVGTGETYTSLTNPGGVFAAINSGTVTSNIVVTITSDLTAETGAVSLNQFAGTFTADFQPLGSRVVSGSNTTTLININGADRVTFNGLNAGGNSLLIRNTSGSSGSVIRYIADASLNNLLNTTIESNTTSTSVIVNTGTTTGNDNIVISGNVIRDRTDAVGAPLNGIQSSGTSAAISNSNLSITNNSITNFNQAGIITFTGTDGLTITGNDVSQTAPRTTSLFGINIVASTGTNLINGNKIHGLRTTGSFTDGMLFSDARSTTVSLNQIYDFPGVAGSTGTIRGIEFDGSSVNPASLTIVNNMISLSPVVNAAVIGMIDFGWGGNTFTADFNNVYLGGSGSTTASDWALLRGGGAPTAFTARNNIFYNDRTGGTGTHFAIGDESGGTGTWVSDFNFFVGTGSTPLNFYEYNGTAVDFATWKLGPPARDAGSTGFAPSFVAADYFVNAAAGDLHLKPTASGVLGGGDATGTGITSDYDNDPRPGNGPDIGADELVQAVAGTIPSGTYYNASGVGGDMLGGDVTVTTSMYLGGIVDAGVNTLTLGCNATVSGAGATSYVDGNFAKDFCTFPQTFTYPVGDPAAGLGAPPPTGYMPVDVTVTALGVNPSSLTVNANNGLAPSSPALNPLTTLSAFWTLTETGDLTATLAFNYQQGDVNGNEAVYRVISSQGGPPNNYPTTVLDNMNNIATVPGIMNFSDWTVGEPFAPTNVAANISGHVVNNTGAPLAGVTMTLLDTILVENRITVTDGNGNYHFDAILTGRQIVVTPAKNGYTFDPSNRAFNHTGELTSVDFVGTDSGSTRSVGSDFDGDGKADLSVFRPSDGTWYTVLSSTGVFKSQQWGVGTDRIVPADYDGDHVTDVAVFRPSTGTWYISQSSTSTMRAVNWGLAEDVVTPADFDGDGHADIAVWRPSTGTWYIIDSHNGQTRTIQWGTTGDRPVAADYDGDGKDDVAVWRPSNGIWYVMKTDGTYTYEHWGIEEDRAVVGDYDGDHKADLAVFRPSTATWYVKLSSDGSINSRGHGTAADILTPGDYDGDGKTDRAVWQTGGDWNILRSTTNTAYGQKWGMTDDIPTTSAYVR